MNANGDGKTAPASPSYTLDALVAAAKVPRRTVRHYIAEGVVPRPRGHGRGTTYGEEHLWRLRAARSLRMEGERLPDIRRRLAEMSLDEVRALVEPPAAPAPAATPATLGDLATERWERATLLPGLELMVRGDAGPLVLRIAREIVANYRAAAT